MDDPIQDSNAEKLWPRSGDRIGGYTLEQELGRGGTSRVWLARYQGSRKRCALKVYSAEYSENPTCVARFLERARGSVGFKHPNFVTVKDAGQDGKHCFIVMEYVEGRSLKEILAERRLSVEEVLTVISGIAETLEAFRLERKLHHGDIKPDNILVESETHRVCLTDMLLFTLPSVEGEMLGTPQYVSPEQIQNGHTDCRSDLYSLGITFYQLMTGKLPFEGETIREILEKQLCAEPELPRKVNPLIPVEIEEMILKLMCKDPGKRYQTPGELLQAVQEYRRQHQKGRSGGQQKIRDQFSDQEKAANMLLKEASGQSKVVRSMQTRREALYRIIFLGILAAVIVMTVGVVFAIRWIVFLPISEDAEYERRLTELQQKRAIVKKLHREKVAAVPVENSTYFLQASQILQFIEKHPTESDRILDQCDRFFRRFPEPDTEKDSVVLNQLLSVFIPLDEVRCESARNQILRSSGETQL